MTFWQRIKSWFTPNWDSDDNVALATAGITTSNIVPEEGPVVAPLVAKGTPPQFSHPQGIWDPQKKVSNTVVQENKGLSTADLITAAAVLGGVEYLSHRSSSSSSSDDYLSSSSFGGGDSGGGGSDSSWSDSGSSSDFGSDSGSSDSGGGD